MKNLPQNKDTKSGWYHSYTLAVRGNPVSVPGGGGNMPPPGGSWFGLTAHTVLSVILVLKWPYGLVSLALSHIMFCFKFNLFICFLLGTTLIGSYTVYFSSLMACLSRASLSQMESLMIGWSASLVVSWPFQSSWSGYASWKLPGLSNQSVSFDSFL